MSVHPASRVNYFDRQFIRLSELTDEQAYHQQLHRRHNLSHHSWGIVAGLELLVQEDRPVVRPGLAVDGYGRELLLVDRRSFSRDDFDRLGTNRIDLWLEYRVSFSDGPRAPLDCGSTDPRRHYRATERAEVTLQRAGALPDPRQPPGVPPEALEEPLLATPDDPGLRWPVYLGRIFMELENDGPPQFRVETGNRVYAGLNAEVIDHPGTAARIEIGHRPAVDEVRTVGDDTWTYAAGADRDFAVFVPDVEGGASTALQPVISVYGTATQIRGSAEVHGHVVLDGASLKFKRANGSSPLADGHPAIYRLGSASGDELRIDVGELNNADRSLVLGVTKDGKFQPAMTIRFPGDLGTGQVNPLITVHGDLHIEGTIDSPDIRTRTVSEDVAALLTGMIQAAIASSGS